MVTSEADLTCRELVELVTAWLDDALPAVDRRRFDAHLDDCPYCRVYLEHIRHTTHLLGELPDDSIDPAVRDALLACFHDWRAG